MYVCIYYLHIYIYIYICVHIWYIYIYTYIHMKHTISDHIHSYVYIYMYISTLKKSSLFQVSWDNCSPIISGRSHEQRQWLMADAFAIDFYSLNINQLVWYVQRSQKHPSLLCWIVNIDCEFMIDMNMNGDLSGDLPSGCIKLAIEHGHRNSECSHW